MRLAILAVLALATPAHAGHSCAETSEVLGRRHCSGFGGWGTLARMPSITFDMEMFHEHFLVPPVEASSTGNAIYASGPVADAGSTAWGGRMRIGAPLMWRPLYMAFELDIGGVAAPSADIASALLSQAVLAVGAHAHLTDSFTVSAELAGGGRMYSWMAHAEVTDGEAVLEARGRLDWWATPHLTFGASIGTSLITSGDQTFTVGFGGHLRALDAYF